MFKKTAARVFAVGVVAAALVASSAVAASADTPAGSAGDFFLIDSETGAAVAPGTELAWLKDVSGNPTASNEAFDQVFTGPAEAEGVIPFIAPRGSETIPLNYVAKAFGAFTDPVAKTVLMSPALLSSFTEGTLGANGVKAQGGDYSLGFAFVKDNGVNVANYPAEGGNPAKPAVFFTHITVTAGTGAWTFDTAGGGGGGGTDGGSFDIDLNATTIQGTPGNLSLVAPAATSAAIGNPQLVNGLSTSTGDLGVFSVKDERYLDPKGWTLTTSVTDFTKSDDTSKIINASQLTIAPKLAEGQAANAAVTLAAAHAAVKGGAGALFAQGSTTEAVGEVKLDAGLTFVSPANMPAGTYNSKMTVTLVSK